MSGWCGVFVYVCMYVCVCLFVCVSVYMLTCVHACSLQTCTHVHVFIHQAWYLALMLIFCDPGQENCLPSALTFSSSLAKVP